jgi:putative ABC transport system permease protein
MPSWRHLTRGLRALTNRKAADQDIADEVEHYLEETTAALMARGLSREEARRTARLEIGNPTVVREQVRAYGWENVIETSLGDIRFAIRRLCHKPGFVAASVLTLALGIGATTAIFSVINGVLLKPLPYPQPEQLVSLWHTAPAVDIKDLEMSPSLYFVYSDEKRAFQDVSMWMDAASTVTGIAAPEEVQVLLVTHRFLPILAVQPALGRGFTISDDDPKSERAVMLSDGYWKSRFGGDPSVLGRRIIVDGNAHEVIGVLPPSFQFMDRNASILTPLRFDRSGVQLGNFSFRGLARLKPGVTLEEASADIGRMLPMASGRFPPPAGYSANMFNDARIGPNLRFLKEDVVGDVEHTLWVLMGTLGIILLIACANVANLLLVRADGRHHELAIRAALGAGGSRIARELLLESLLLGLTGGVAGLALAHEGLRMLVASEAANLPRIQNISIDPHVLAFTLCISLAASFGFGLIPVWKYARPHLSDALRGAVRSLSQTRERSRARNALVVVQVTLALLLLVSSGLMIRTFQALRHVDPGFSGANEVQTLRISIPEILVREPERVLRMEHDILERIKALPGVSSAAAMNSLPLSGGGPGDPIYAEDRAYREGTMPPVRRYKFVSPGYVSAMGTRLIAGREFTWAETYSHRPVVLLSANLAREFWHDPRAALGKRIRSALNDYWCEVVGVVADLHEDGLDQKAPTIVYWPMLLKSSEDAAIAVRGYGALVMRTPRAGSTALLQEVRQAVASVNPDLPLANVRTLGEIYDRSLARTSFTLALLAIAGGMALLLSVIGIYGVIAYSVSQRTREIGIRLALGAPMPGVTGMFVRHGLALSAIGAVCGLAAALTLTRLMKSLLFNVNPADPLTYVLTSASLILAAVLASYLPARRATKVDPVVTLRSV